METAHDTNSRNIAGGFLLGASVCLWTTLFILAEVWARAAPVATEQAIYRHKGLTCIGYFTAFQATACALMLLALPLFAVGFAITPKKNARTRTGPLSWSFTFDPDDPGKVHGRSMLAGAVLTFVAIFTLGPMIARLLLSAGVFFNLG
jgi:hypothetical protein